MPKVSPEQFKNYVFEAGTDDEGTTHVVAFKSNKDDTGMYPIGSMRIDASERRANLAQQERIDRGEEQHGIAVGHSGTGDLGQLKWTGGTMNDSIDKVSWLAMDPQTTPRRDAPHVLRAMLGIGVETHGSVPHADYDLSNYGSRIAKAMHRRYGIRPHPHNPHMNPTFSWGNESTLPDAIRWNADDSVAELQGTVNFKSYEDPSEIAGVAQKLADVSSARRKKPSKTLPGQDPLPGMD